MNKKYKSKGLIRNKTGPSRKKQEIAISGWRACIRLFQNRPQDIIRVYFSKERSSKLQAIKQYCSDRRLPYRQLTMDEMSRVGSSVHHEGIVVVTRPPTLKSTLELFAQNVKSFDVLVALDGVGNSHNLGTIMRTAAFFGVKGLVTGWDEGKAGITPSAIRMAEGGFEEVPIYHCRDLASFLRDSQKKGTFILGAESKAQKSLYQISFKKPCILVMGNESEGLSSKVKRRCDALVSLAGNKNMDSLNVSVATGIFLAELYRKEE